MLVSTDCAGMGVHVPDLRLVVNVGMTMIEIFSQNCSLHTLIFQDFQGTCGRCPRHLGGPVVTRSCKQLVCRCTGQAKKVFLSGFFISTVMHATHATIITTECTTRPQTSLLEIKFKLFTGKTTPAGKVREIFTGQVCRRAAINAAFSLSNVHSNDSFLKRLFV